MSKTKNNFSIAICAAAMMFIASSVSAQTPVKPAKTDDKESKTGTAVVGKPKPNSGLVAVSTTNENDRYQGREKEILNNLIVDKIPTDFPMYLKGKGVKWYNEQIDDYYRMHPEILKENVRKKLGL